MIFVNVYEYSSGPHGDYVLYRMYSGDSEQDIKRTIVSHLSDPWDDGENDDALVAFNSIDLNLSFKDISIKINKIINDFIDESKLYEYDLIIGDPTSDIYDCLNFYEDYKEAEINGEDNYDGVGFYFYGGYSIEVQEIFPYVYDLMKDYGVVIDNKIFDKIKELI